MDEQSASSSPLPLIKVVGVSASGKSALVKKLRQAGYEARPVSQEHSYVPDLWQQFDQPTLLIYLDTELAEQQRRRPDVSWSKRYLQTERSRLAHARDHADLKIDTSAIAAETVWRIVELFVKQQGLEPAAHPLPSLNLTGSATLTMGREETEQPDKATGKKKRRSKKRKRE